MVLYLLIGVLVVLILWLISTYNFFVTAKARIKGAVQEIGNQLKRQADLIPNLEESVKGYLKHESSIFKELAEARKAISAASDSGDANKMAKAGSKLSELLPKLQVVVESNPELKASEVVTNLMDELRDTADKVMYARRLVIDLTADFNARRATFPSNLIANMLKVEELPGLITPEEETKTPKVNF